MDAFAVAICNSLSLPKIKKREIIFIALTFGLMQGIMPLIGYYVGSMFDKYLMDYQKWISFAILLLIGTKMVYEGIKSLKSKCENDEKKFSYKLILVQGVATSIDALAIGVTLIGFSISIYINVSIIAIITFFVSLIGILIGHFFGKLLKGKSGFAEIIGGLVLIGIGVSFLFR